jgi:dTDP-4-dehydrorhamnose 3,5-epimerase
MIKKIKPKKYGDHRGFFAEIYNKKKYLELGINEDFVQINHSISDDIGTLRGLHFQSPPFAQGKLVRCGRGAIFDVAVDIRRGSMTFGKWQGFELTANNGYQIYIPPGFAHGFVTLEPESEIVYKCTNYYAPEAEKSLYWNDPDINIEWPLNVKPILSEKDRLAPLFKNFQSPFIFGENS